MMILKLRTAARVSPAAAGVWKCGRQPEAPSRPLDHSYPFLLPSDSITTRPSTGEPPPPGIIDGSGLRLLTPPDRCGPVPGPRSVGENESGGSLLLGSRALRRYQGCNACTAAMLAKESSVRATGRSGWEAPGRVPVTDLHNKSTREPKRHPRRRRLVNNVSCRQLLILIKARFLEDEAGF